jgi:hypothetical protein
MVPADGMSAAVKIKKRGQSARPTSSSLKRLYLFPYVGNVTRARVSVRFAVWKVAGRVAQHREMRPRSDTGQTEKNSVRAHVFRFALELGHCSTQLACLKRANFGLAT